MSVSRATASTISFPMTDASNRPARKSGASVTTQISRDGAAFASTSNAATEIGTTGRYALTLTAAEMAASYVHVVATATGCDDSDIMFQTTGLIDGIVTGTPSATAVTASAFAQPALYWTGSFLRFTSGALAGQVRQVTAYATGTFTVGALTAAPAVGDRFVLINA